MLFIKASRINCHKIILNFNFYDLVYSFYDIFSDFLNFLCLNIDIVPHFQNYFIISDTYICFNKVLQFDTWEDVFYKYFYSFFTVDFYINKRVCYSYINTEVLSERLTDCFYDTKIFVLDKVFVSVDTSSSYFYF